MRLQRFGTMAVPFLMLAWALHAPVLAQDPPPPPPGEEQPEVLTSGPVHEAFAEPVSLQAEENVVAAKEPPPSIQELPPAERPQGNQYTWVPGYWAWDAVRGNYIWVSACWRVAPPNMTWVPGYWHRVPGGWEWVAGFWMPAGVQEIEYLPAPPAIQDIQPPVAAPSSDRIWVPSCYYWRDGRYVLRAGYWMQPQAGWIWVPSRTVWTPRGYVFLSGHWDYSLERRGVLFAPVRLPGTVIVRTGYVYSPTVVVDLNILTVNLFTHPRYHHYYFGDFYDDVYVRIGIHPWFDHAHIHAWYDPIFVHDRWHHRAEPRWEEHVRHEYDLRRADRDLRPPRTYRELETRVARLPEAKRRNIEVAKSLTVVASSKTTTVKFERITTETRQSVSKRAAEVHKYRDERSRWESTTSSPRTQRNTDRSPGNGPREVGPTRPERVKVPSAPIERRRPGSDRDGEPPRQPNEESRRGR